MQSGNTLNTASGDGTGDLPLVTRAWVSGAEAAGSKYRYREQGRPPREPLALGLHLKQSPKWKACPVLTEAGAQLGIWAEAPGALPAGGTQEAPSRAGLWAAPRK